MEIPRNRGKPGTRTASEEEALEVILLLKSLLTVGSARLRRAELDDENSEGKRSF